MAIRLLNQLVSVRSISLAVRALGPRKVERQIITLDEKDLKEEFIHSSGHGGQSVNKTCSSVRLLHVPSGIVVKVVSVRATCIHSVVPTNTTFAAKSSNCTEYFNQQIR